MTIDLEFIAGCIGTFGALITPVWLLMRKINGFFERLKGLESWTRKQQLDIEKSQRERALILSGTLACLKGLREQGCDGAVIKSIAEIEAFLFEEATKGKSENDFVKRAC